MTRAEILDHAKKCVCGQRTHDYGSPEDNFTTIAHLWSAYMRAAHPEMNIANDSISPKDVAVMMSLLKVARIATGSSPDSFVDLAGYAACAGEIATKTAIARNENTCVMCGASIPEGTQVCHRHSSI
jgi:hypothetical protein